MLSLCLIVINAREFIKLIIHQYLIFIYAHLESIHSSISFFIKTILLDDIFTFGGKSPFFTKRLIVDTDSPIKFDASLIVKEGRFS